MSSTKPFPPSNSYPQNTYWTAYGGAQIANAIMGSGGLTVPATWYLGLLQYDLSTGTTELTAPGYARKAISFASVTTISGYNYVETASDVIFDIPTGAAEVASWVGLFDAATGGHMWMAASLCMQRFVWSGYPWAMYEMAYSLGGPSGTQPVDGDTFTIGSTVFTWKNTPVAATDVQAVGGWDPATACDNMATTLLANGFGAVHAQITQAQSDWEDVVVAWNPAGSVLSLSQSLSVKGSGWQQPQMQVAAAVLTIPAGFLYFYLIGGTGALSVTSFLVQSIRSMLFAALFNGGTFTALAGGPLQASLHTGDPLDDLSQIGSTEVSAGDYARFTIAFQSPGTTGTNLSIGLSSTITRPPVPAVANWGTLSWMVIWDTAGTGLMRLVLSPGVLINIGDQIQFHNSSPNYSASGIILDWWI